MRLPGMHTWRMAIAAKSPICFQDNFVPLSVCETYYWQHKSIFLYFLKVSLTWQANVDVLPKSIYRSFTLLIIQKNVKLRKFVQFVEYAGFAKWAETSLIKTEQICDRWVSLRTRLCKTIFHGSIHRIFGGTNCVPFRNISLTKQIMNLRLLAWIQHWCPAGDHNLTWLVAKVTCFERRFCFLANQIRTGMVNLEYHQPVMMCGKDCECRKTFGHLMVVMIRR